MIPMIMIGMAAMLLTLGIIMMLVGYGKEEPGVFAGGIMMLVMLIDVLVCAGLVMGAITPIAGLTSSSY